MALYDEITSQVLENCVNDISSKYFTTLTVIDKLEKLYPDIVEKVKAYSTRNWRAVIGRALKRFSLETNLIAQVSSASETPARWEKI
ncbi:MAG: hypothetical protein BWY26_00038 [Elusimicrobia bacterium ADurb.Bin231]|nr:MAG: hypothetical protein BWY26_00038 [Elusimicrobia bacterium ADurb.Bin231]